MSCGTAPGGRCSRPRQHAGLELVLARGALDGVDAVGAQAGAGGDDLGEAGAAEQQADAVVDAVARRQRARGDRVQVRRAAVGLAVVVHRVRAGQEAEAGDRPRARRCDFVMPPSNQHIAPALSPASTIPACHASRRIASSPCARQIASRLSIEPPPT